MFSIIQGMVLHFAISTILYRLMMKMILLEFKIRIASSKAQLKRHHDERRKMGSYKHMCRPQLTHSLSVFYI